MSLAGNLLREAASLVDGDRESTHGAKERSFAAIASMWTAYLKSRRAPNGPVRPHDVAHMMTLLKQCRAEHGTAVKDHFTDGAGYEALAGELALAPNPVPTGALPGVPLQAPFKIDPAVSAAVQKRMAEAVRDGHLPSLDEHRAAERARQDLHRVVPVGDWSAVAAAPQQFGAEDPGQVPFYGDR